MTEDKDQQTEIDQLKSIIVGRGERIDQLNLEVAIIPAFSELAQEWRALAKGHRAKANWLAAMLLDDHAERLELIIGPAKPSVASDVQADHELKLVVQMVRLTLTERDPDFIHSERDAKELLWRWFLKWRHR